MPIKFITASQALTLQHHLLLQYGGKSGMASPEALASALAQPRASMLGAYLHETPLQMARAYYFYVNKNRPFYSHNQKTAFLCAALFLELNGLPARQALEFLND